MSEWSCPKGLGMKQASRCLGLGVLMLKTLVMQTVLRESDMPQQRA